MKFRPGLLSEYSEDDPRFALSYAGGGVSGATPQGADALGRVAYGFTGAGGVQDAAGLLGGPSLPENVKGGNYLDAALQGAGVLPIVGGVAKGLLGAGALYKAAKMGAPEIKAALDPSVVRMFLGPNAKTADKAALAEAEALHSSGASREDIWNKTGWFKGVDDKWRFEIPDDKSFFKGVKGSKTVGDALTHDELYKSYPAAADVALDYNPNSKARANGSFTAHPLYKHGGKIELTGPTDAGSTTLHELQHYIQEQEDFAQGGMPEPIKKGSPGWDIYKQNPAITLPEMTREQFVATLPDDPRISISGSWMNYQQALDKKNKSIVKQAKAKASHEGYRRLAGEVEARTTQKRIDMDMAARKARYPWLDYDVPEEQQIVRFRGLLGK